MVRELIPRPLPVKAQLYLAYEDSAKLRARIATLEAQLAAERAAHAETKRERDDALKALDGLLEPFEGDDCHYDHHGYCQAHFLQEGDECYVKIARRVHEGGEANG